MSRQRDYSTEAEGLYRRFAARHGLQCQKIEPAPIEVLVKIPPQPGLSFELTLGLQNNDEINIGFEGFWSYFFPYEEAAPEVEKALDAIMMGDCRQAVHSRRGAIIRRVLEQRIDGRWEPIYAAGGALRLPFGPVSVAYIRNEAAPARD